MRIIVDVMGGDEGTRAAVIGSANAAKDFGVEVCMVGKESLIREILAAEKLEHERISILDADDIITMEDDPLKAIRQKKTASMTVALTALADGKGDALVSSGNTGALLTGATLLVKRLDGVRRGALGTLIPNGKTGVLLMDSGANVECTTEYLMQFAYIGSVYAKRVMGIKNPRIGLANNGTEEKKGTPLQVETYKALKEAHEAGLLNFVGNVEGRDIMNDVCDVLVADGFTGNLVLKTIEGVAAFLVGQIKGIFKKNLLTKLAAMAVMPGMKDFKKMLDYKEVGGAPILGIRKPVLKAHGASDPKAFYNAVRQAKLFAESGAVEACGEELKAMADRT